jgi:LysM repeat protein
MRRRLQEPRLVLFVCGSLVTAACQSSKPILPKVREIVAKPASQEPVVPAGWRRVVVQPGDTLGGIARCRRVDVAAIVDANGLADPDRIVAGTRLYVPPRNRCARVAAPARPAPAAPEAPPAPTPEQRQPAPAPAAAPTRIEDAERKLASARSLYDAADFAGALDAAQAAVRTVDGDPGVRASDDVRARAHLIAGLSAAGLEQRERAIAEFRRAFDVDPALRCPPDDCSPRVMELVDAARPTR